MNEQSNFFDILNLVSLIVGIQNLKENREQSRQNDVNEANDQQARYILSEISRRFEEQDKKIDKILEILGGTNEH